MNNTPAPYGHKIVRNVVFVPEDAERPAVSTPAKKEARFIVGFATIGCIALLLAFFSGAAMMIAFRHNPRIYSDTVSGVVIALSIAFGGFAIYALFSLCRIMKQ